MQTHKSEILTSCQAAREHVLKARRSSHRVGLVPTMGALHDGHLSLVEASARECDETMVSIFVNPTQFGAGEDFQAYPRDLDADLQRLRPLGVGAIFAPTTEEMYPEGYATTVQPGGIARPLEGRCRPGHFAGVATVVLKLFSAVPADIAFFGEKDYQQSRVVQQMVKDLDLPIAIRVCPTIRDDDGLALSSRNAYLSPDQHRRALTLPASLRRAAEVVVGGERDARAIIREMRNIIDPGDQGDDGTEVRIDYVALCDPQTLAPVAVVDRPVVALLAVRVGGTRLIDNAVLDPAGQN